MNSRCQEAKRIADLERENAKLREQITEYQTLLDQQHLRTLDADKLWQKAHNKPGVYPDLGELIEWLMRRRETE